METQLYVIPVIRSDILVTNAVTTNSLLVPVQVWDRVCVVPVVPLSNDDASKAIAIIL